MLKVHMGNLKVGSYSKVGVVLVKDGCIRLKVSRLPWFRVFSPLIPGGLLSESFRASLKSLSISVSWFYLGSGYWQEFI